MRKLIAIIIAIMAFIPMAKADKYTINRENLPPTAREMLDKHFPKAKVAMIKVDRHLFKKTDYDVKLTNGTKIEFANSGRWTSVDCRKKSVPETIVPRKIRRHVEKNYPGETIVRIAKKRGGHIVGLSNGDELRFNVLGQLRKTIDESAPSPDDPEPEEETDLAGN